MKEYERIWKNGSISAQLSVRQVATSFLYQCRVAAARIRKPGSRRRGKEPRRKETSPFAACTLITSSWRLQEPPGTLSARLCTFLASNLDQVGISSLLKSQSCEECSTYDVLAIYICINKCFIIINKTFKFELKSTANCIAMHLREKRIFFCSWWQFFFFLFNFFALFNFDFELSCVSFHYSMSILLKSKS